MWDGENAPEVGAQRHGKAKGPHRDRRLTSATEGAVIPRLYGRMRMGGNIIWATDFREETKTTTQGGGKGGGGGKVKTTEYLYYASFAVALCEGPITGIGRIWADGKPMDLSGVTWRWYPGDEAQTADPFIAAKMGSANTPAYRGTAYVVFEELALSTYGNRLPQLSFEVFRPLANPDTAEGLTRAVTMIPASGEFTYATQAIRKTDGGATMPENLNALADSTDMVEALDRLQAMAPAVESVSLVVAWFGDDLRAGSCKVRPGVEVSAKPTTPASWSVNGVSRANAFLVSRDDQDRPVYGGTPADFAVVQAIQEMKDRALRVTFYPFILMDVPPGNTLPNPYSDYAAETGQPVFPWRGRITCSPAAGFAGTVDKTATAAAQVAALFGAATPASFSVSGQTVSWIGAPGDWGLRRMVLHYAHLCAAAGGVDVFLIGTEMPGLTTIRSGASTYPAVQAYRDLLADVRSILGSGTKIGYAADWSEYFGHQPGDGSGDVFFHLDPLWADPEIDFVGIDNYMPLSDWRDGFEHLDAAEGWPAIYDRAYLQGNIAGGEGFDWFYASAADRTAQMRTPITDGAVAKPWVFRYKDLRAWWSNPHYNRPGGIESGTPTAWAPQSKPICFTELGCPAIDRGTNQPNVFFDPKSSESFTPHFSRGWRDDAIQRAYLEATYLWWGEAANNPLSSVYGGRMVHVPECAAWTWDARPYPFFPALTDVWTDGANWRLGHWLTGRLGAVSLAALMRHLCLRAGLPESRIDVTGLWGAVEGYAITALESPRASSQMPSRRRTLRRMLLMLRSSASAIFTAVVFGDDEAQQGIAPSVVDADGNRVEQFEPGLIAYARGGKDIRFNQPSATGGYGEYKRARPRSAAAPTTMGASASRSLRRRAPRQAAAVCEWVALAIAMSFSERRQGCARRASASASAWRASRPITASASMRESSRSIAQTPTRPKPRSRAARNARATLRASIEEVHPVENRQKRPSPGFVVKRAGERTRTQKTFPRL
jgi:hypothetical protein